jgi:hypothetical protein
MGNKLTPLDNSVFKGNPASIELAFGLLRKLPAELLVTKHRERSLSKHRGFLCRLVYGLDYRGNVCGADSAQPNLVGFDTRYWMNPQQIYDSGNPLNPFSLSDARRYVQISPEVGLNINDLDVIHLCPSCSALKLDIPAVLVSCLKPHSSTQSWFLWCLSVRGVP